MSSNSVVSLSSFNILYFTQVLTVLTSSIKYHEYVTDKGKNISVPCTAEGSVMWVKESGNNSTIIQTGKFLVFTNISADAGGLYVCFAAISPHQSSVFEADSNAVATRNTTNEMKKSIPPLSPSLSASSLPTSMPSTSSSSSSSSSPLSSTADIMKIATIVNTSATNASTTSSLPISVPTINVVTATDIKTSNIITTQNVAISDKAATVDNGGQTMGAVPVELSDNIEPQTSRDTQDEEMFAVEQQWSRNSESGVRVDDKRMMTEIEEYQAAEKVNLTVRTPPGPVTQLYFKASTILGFLIWRFNKANSGGYPIRSFTAEFRNISYSKTPYNKSFEHEWSRMDPVNIAPNVRQMEVYRLEPNTTYEFRIWANNQLGNGEVVTTNVTTLPETKEEDGWESIELIPNIILNPGFCESEGKEPVQQHTRTIIFGEDDDSDGYGSEESDHEPTMEKFKRKVSVFFTGPTIRRI
ncbi:contactin-2 isoform X2 [Eurosta solidaginis]|uniref:contactin-2 isoform X2 n=1 Tax=Eurosta solidaginis TaxID=178769 RepID=UPI0035309097